MAFVVCEPCRDCKYTDCVVVCPCECFYEDDRQLYINPQNCIDCAACKEECPVGAIFPDIGVPSQWSHYVEMNAEKSAELIASNRGHITEKRARPGD